jgi:hypothetical protein
MSEGGPPPSETSAVSAAEPRNEKFMTIPAAGPLKKSKRLLRENSSLAVVTTRWEISSAEKRSRTADPAAGAPRSDRSIVSRRASDPPPLGVAVSGTFARSPLSTSAFVMASAVYRPS